MKLQDEVLVEQHHAVIHVVEHRLHDVAGARDVFLAVLQGRDVAEQAEQADADRLVLEFDIAPAHGAPLVAHAARIAHHRGALVHRLFDIVERAEIAALRPESGSPRRRSSVRGQFLRHAQEFREFAVAECPAEIAVGKRDAVVHVVEHGLHQVARLPRPRRARLRRFPWRRRARLRAPSIR